MLVMFFYTGQNNHQISSKLFVIVLKRICELDSKLQRLKDRAVISWFSVLLFYLQVESENNQIKNNSKYNTMYIGKFVSCYTFLPSE